MDAAVARWLRVSDVVFDRVNGLVRNSEVARSLDELQEAKAVIDEPTDNSRSNQILHDFRRVVKLRPSVPLKFLQEAVKLLDSRSDLDCFGWQAMVDRVG